MDYSSIIELEKRLLDSAIRKNTEELKQLLCDDFFEIGTSGKTYDKKVIIERLTDEVPSIVEAIDFRAVELAPDVVQLRFKTRRQNADGSISASLRSSIWKLIENKWRIVFHQGTQTSP